VRFYWERFRYSRLPAPLTERAAGLEECYPWRTGNCRIFRLPYSRWAIAVGRWTGQQAHENVDGIPSLTFRPLDHPEDYFHAVLGEPKNRPGY
jgi:hypothetical protein